jgi:sodium transport system permease protein
MRWPIIRLIWLRDLKDQLRDRRTVFMIAVLPILLYPLAGLGMLVIAPAFHARPAVVGVEGASAVLPWAPGGVEGGAGHVASWWAAAPAAPGVAPLCAALALQAGAPPLPPLLVDGDDGPVVPPRYVQPPGLRVVVLPGAPPVTSDEVRTWPLESRQVDVLLAFPPSFQASLAAGLSPPVFLLARDDDASQQARARLQTALIAWKQELRAASIARLGLPRGVAEGFHVLDPALDRPAAALSRQALFSTLVRVFPFILVMWALAGALYPAVDLCAGEKERGTMETLLISPASREEIVYGKFLTIWVFSASTALLNLFSMAATSFGFASAAAPLPSFRPAALFWAVVLLMPLSAFFSALCLAVGAYARSSKEGQYYLMPLFLGTMPLIGLTLAPGVELNPFYCMVPVTGVALLLQRLVAASADATAWAYLLPVLAPMLVYSWLALRWAVAQFHSEEVLFREAEQLDLRAWASRLLREKEPWPTAGEALFCFVLLLVLRWASLGLGGALPGWAREAVGQLAFVAAPALIMAVLLTTRPIQSLGLRRPPAWAWPMAALLAVAALPPLANLGLALVQRSPEALQALRERAEQPWTLALASAVPAAVCEELAFRGFILAGLLRAFRFWTALLLSAFLFSVFQMNVFQALPAFLLGVLLGLLVARAGSIWPAILLRLVQALLTTALPSEPFPLDRMGYLSAALGGALALAGLAAVWWLGRRTALPGQG